MRQKIVKAAKAPKSKVDASFHKNVSEVASRWREDNKQAFEATRRRIEKHGLWNDRLRSWE
jgi:post-segregation antitoxin (ccd killing protein)